MNFSRFQTTAVQPLRLPFGMYRAAADGSKPIVLLPIKGDTLKWGK